MARASSTKPATKPASKPATKPASKPATTQAPPKRKPAAKKPSATSKAPVPGQATKRPAARSSKRPATRSAALPKALAERAKAMHAAKQARLLAQGRAAIARIRECQADIAANIVDIGLALVDLKAEGVAEALGRATFAEVCENDLGMPASTALRFIALATKVPREMVKSLGPDRAHAVLELMDATPEDDAPEALLHSKLALPSGRTLDVAAASTEELRDAAKEIRAARAVRDSAAPGKRSRGFTTTPAEKKTFAAVLKRLQSSGHEGGKLLAMRDGKGAKVRFEVRLAELSAFARALGEATKG